MKILLVNVTEDSRCPSDVACVWEGQVAVVVNVSQGDQMMGSFELVSRAGYENMSVKNFDGYSIELLGVEPYPESSRMDLSEYTVELKVSR